MRPRILKECADSLTAPFFVFQRSLNEMLVPVDWKNGNISVIEIIGDMTIVSNYRPVSINSVICKVFKSIIKDHPISYLLDNDLICIRQFGFMHGRSTSLQLLNVLDD